MAERCVEPLSLPAASATTASATTALGTRAPATRPTLSAAPPRSRGVVVSMTVPVKPGTRHRTAIATRRTAAARSWPPVIAHPTTTAFLTSARACGRRSSS